MDIVGLGYLGLESPNAKDWLTYGPEVLGFGLNESRADEVVRLRMDDRHHRIAVRPGPVDRLAYLGWEVKHRVAFEAAVARLEAAGIEVTMGDADLEEERAVLEVAQFVDPVGFAHEIFYGQRFHPGSFQPGRPMRGFLAEDLGLGHVVLIHPEPNPALRTFCEDVMGFKWFGHGVKKGLGSFYRTKLNPRSHCISYACIPGMSGLHHVGIEVRELDDVGVAYDITQEREIPLHMTLGRHAQDPVISFYTYTCSGGMVEYIWGGSQIPDDVYVEKAPERLSVWGHKPVSNQLPSTLHRVASA